MVFCQNHLEASINGLAVGTLIVIYIHHDFEHHEFEQLIVLQIDFPSIFQTIHFVKASSHSP